jgi:hypothetical protein
MAIWNHRESLMNQNQHRTAVSAPGTFSSERRAGPDRRRHSWRTLTYCGLHGRGRRRQVRRQGHNYYLDWYDPALVFTGLAVLFMSAMDALFTLSLIGKGAYEANIFMARLMDVSVHVFVWSKVAITAASVMFLLMHANFQILGITSGKRLLQFMVPIYVLLLAYELFLLGALT